ncbi:hypothetical protein XELAEV_18033638mg [Xenopus laevis]|uniref:Secreted protein n=1 Tax=Xenopus laevis TaxID=8355 RepID=A0A974CLZ8_XENLA|nr:hypothetical protein XELAEV_18033638mg [Xenopus laevis]
MWIKIFCLLFSICNIKTNNFPLCSQLIMLPRHEVPWLRLRMSGAKRLEFTDITGFRARMQFYFPLLWHKECCEGLLLRVCLKVDLDELLLCNAIKTRLSYISIYIFIYIYLLY